MYRPPHPSIKKRKQLSSVKSQRRKFRRSSGCESGGPAAANSQHAGTSNADECENPDSCFDISHEHSYTPIQFPNPWGSPRMGFQRRLYRSPFSDSDHTTTTVDPPGSSGSAISALAITDRVSTPFWQRSAGLGNWSEGSSSSVADPTMRAEAAGLGTSGDVAGLPLSTLALNTPTSCQKTPPQQLVGTPFKTPLPSVRPRPPVSLAKRRDKYLCLDPKQLARFEAFMKNDPIIAKFLRYDYCRKLSDPFLLAMVYVYFERLNGQYGQKISYNRLDFFALLYLANDVEEDSEEDRYEMLPWALGEDWFPDRFKSFYHRKNELTWAMEYRVLVCQRTLHRVLGMSEAPGWWAERQRSEIHSGAERPYLNPYTDEERFPKGPDKTPLHCQPCIDKMAVADLPTGLRPRKVLQRDRPF